MSWKDDSIVNAQMRKLFSDYLPETEVPVDLKDQVFNSIDQIHLMTDVFDLFTGKFGETQAHLISILNKSKDSKDI
jgi:hypothetical protein